MTEYPFAAWQAHMYVLLAQDAQGGFQKVKVP